VSRLTIHPQVRVRANGMDARVDAGIADLIRECWRADVDTYMSCENQGKRDGSPCDVAWLQLHGADAERLIGIVGASDLLDGDDRQGELFSRIHGTLGAERETHWSYGAAWHHIAGQPRVFVSIRFPVTDMPLIVERLRAHNRRQRQRVEP
jgi:hypothetical protein